MAPYRIPYGRVCLGCLSFSRIGSVRLAGIDRVALYFGESSEKSLLKAPLASVAATGIMIF